MYGLEKENDETQGRHRQGEARRRRLLILALVVLAASGCARMFQNQVARGDASRMLPRFATCPDGEAVRLLIDRHCPGSVCGYSCLPQRWRGATDDDSPR